MKSRAKRIAAVLATFAMAFLPTVGTAETDMVTESYRIDCRKLPGDAAVYGYQYNPSDEMTLEVGNRTRRFQGKKGADLYIPRTPSTTGSAKSPTLSVYRSHDYCRPWD